MYRRILYPTDGSAGASVAAGYAFSLASRDGAEVHALSVVDTTRVGEPALSSTELVVDAAEDAAADVLADVVARGEERGLRVVTRSCHGDPHDEILAYATEVDADCIVMGRSGKARSRRRRGRGATVADRVEADWDRDLLVVG